MKMKTHHEHEHTHEHLKSTNKINACVRAWGVENDDGLRGRQVWREGEGGVKT